MKEFFYNIATDRIDSFPAKMLKIILSIFAVLYDLILRVVHLGYKFSILKRISLNKKVISVGNITLGGVGKTPLVELIAEYLKENNIKPAILIRGYMDSSSKSKASKSDEAEALRSSLKDVPILVGKDRAKNAIEFLSGNSADVFIMDDGFQHWRLARDLDIVAIDATNPFGNGKLIPRGILREPIDSISRVDMIVITKADAEHQDLTVRLKMVNTDCPVIETVHRPYGLRNLKDNSGLELSYLNGKTVCLLCSIGDPGSFKSSLLSLGVHVGKSFSFMDHYVYGESDALEINKFCIDSNIDTIATTSKDAVKLKPFLHCFDERITLLALGIKIDIVKGKEIFFDKILSLCGK